MAIYAVVGGFILFDIITGILKAFYNGNINSTNLRQGLYHKLSEVIAIIGCGLGEYGLNYVNIGVDVPLVSCVSIYICIAELVSIVENLSEINPTLKEFFKPYLEKIKGGNRNDGDKGN